MAEMARGAGLERIERVVASGNGVRKNPLVARIIEEEFGVPCVVGQAVEEAALGAGIAAAAGLGLIERKAAP